MLLDERLQLVAYLRGDALEVPLLRVIRRMGEVATTSAVRLPPESIPILPKTSPGPSDPITSPPLITSAVPASMTIRT